MGADRMNHGEHGQRGAFASITTLFFAWGFITASVDPLIAALKAIFSLSYREAGLTQFAFFIAYGVVSLPAAALVRRAGYPSAIVIALAVMIVGCLVIPLATHFETYALVLVALFIIAGGITVLQVAANPLAAELGPPGRLALPPHLFPGLQLPRHDDRPVPGLFAAACGGHVRGGRGRGAHCGGPHRVTTAHWRGVLHHRRAHRAPVAVHLGAASAPRRGRAAAGRGAGFRHQPRAEFALGTARGRRDLSVRRRRGLHRQLSHQLPASAERVRRLAAAGGPARELLLGWRDAGAVRRQRIAAAPERRSPAGGGGRLRRTPVPHGLADPGEGRAEWRR